jgi:hypothetical protein
MKIMNGRYTLLEYLSPRETTTLLPTEMWPWVKMRAKRGKCGLKADVQEGQILLGGHQAKTQATPVPLGDRNDDLVSGSDSTKP